MQIVVERILAVGLLLAVCLCGEALSTEDTLQDRPGAERLPVYQRLRQVGSPAYGDRFAPGSAQRSYGPMRNPASGRHFRPQQPVGHGAWFQRPYPYHLDYYRLRYGGTYEPYHSGGLYGTPQIVVPPAFGYGHPYAYGYPQPLPPVPEILGPPEGPSDPEPLQSDAPHSPY